MFLLKKTRNLAIKESKKRYSVRQHLIDFTIYTKWDYCIGKHYYLLCEKLEAVERGEISRLMVFMPPKAWQE